MANIVRHDPFAVDDLFDDLMKGFFIRPVRYPGGETPVQIKMDVKEDDKGYTVHAEMPGVKKEGEKVIHSERYYGKVYRSFTLGQDVDDANAKAKFADGVLELTLPKKATTSARRLDVE